MDIWYIILNTIIYGCCALILADMFSYWKIFNFALWSYIMFAGYIIFNCINYWFNTINICAIMVLLISFFLINKLLLKIFPSSKKRTQASLIVTLWISLFLDNFCNFIYWWRWVSLPTQKFNFVILTILFLIIFIVFFYFHRISFYWKTLNAINENENIVLWLWIKKDKIIQIWFILLFLIIVLLWYILIINWSIKMQSWLFYVIKWIWIMLLVWLAKKEWIFLWALIYVIIEYILFNKLWLPIAYKETFILLCVALILLFKPEWLFSIRSRKL